jgi:uncharacterized membrane protein
MLARPSLFARLPWMVLAPCPWLAFVAGAWAAGGDPVPSTSEAEFDWRAFLAPFHTVTLHLPIGFVAIAALLEGYGFLRPSPQLRGAINLVLWATGLSAVVVAALGVFRGAGGGYDEELLAHHERFGIAVAAVSVAMAAVHTVAFRGGIPRRALGGVYRAMLAANLVLITITGHGGGNLTHGSKYLVEGAPPWVKEWLARREGGRGGSEADRGSGHYAEAIRPAFEEKCFSCHGPEKQQGDYRMDTVEGLFAAGESELPAIVPGNPLESYLVELITLPAEDDLAMPPEGKPRLTAEETLAVIQWIWDGADTGEAR